MKAQSEQISKYFGQTAYNIRFLNRGNLHQITELNAHVMNNIDDPVMYHPPYDVELLSFCLCEGLAIGVFYENRLVAYQVTYYSDSRCEDPGADLGIPNIRTRNAAQFHGIAVHSLCRSRGFGLAMTKYAIHAVRNARVSHAAATCHPDNLHSLTILFTSGFRIKGLKNKYGGKLRYILHKEFGGDGFSPGVRAVADHKDIKTQKRMLAEGYVGVGTEKSDEGYGIVFAR
ncbi:hypothetical protein QUF80_20015 [Desulfococcaceae bacterium HSG8]|nr:hypothetical protein [Desulfococcaceae bacterium HSG8]